MVYVLMVYVVYNSGAPGHLFYYNIAKQQMTSRSVSGRTCKLRDRTGADIQVLGNVQPLSKVVRYTTKMLSVEDSNKL